MGVLLFLGVVAVVLGGIGTLIASFKTSILWGLGCLFIAPISLLFLIFHWDVARNPFLLQVVGIALMFFGSSAEIQ